MNKYAHKYTPEQEEWLRQNTKGRSNQEITDLFNLHFNENRKATSIQNKRNTMGLKSGVNAGCYKKGHVPANKGVPMSKEKYEKCKVTFFKKGDVPKSTKNVGHERVMKSGYIHVKVDDKLYGDKKNWKSKQRHIWEQHYGAVPEGYVVIFADGDTRNFDIDNLVLISRKENAYMNQNGLRYNNADLTKTGVNVAKLMIKVKEKEGK